MQGFIRWYKLTTNITEDILNICFLIIFIFIVIAIKSLVNGSHK